VVQILYTYLLKMAANIYMDMLQLFAFPEEGGGGKILFLHDGSSAHLGHDLWNIPKLRFPNRWFGRGEPKPWTHEVLVLNSLSGNF